MIKHRMMLLIFLIFITTNSFANEQERYSFSGKPQDEAFCKLLGDPRIYDPKCLTDNRGKVLKKTSFWWVYYPTLVDGTIRNVGDCTTPEFSKPLLTYLKSKNIKHDTQYTSNACQFAITFAHRKDLCQAQNVLVNPLAEPSFIALDVLPSGEKKQRKTLPKNEC